VVNIAGVLLENLVGRKQGAIYVLVLPYSGNGMNHSKSRRDPLPHLVYSFGITGVMYCTFSLCTLRKNTYIH
jgi:hypothetical protein